MTPKKVILVTGVSQYWGAQVACRLIEMSEQYEEQGSEFHVMGLDVEPPGDEIKGLDFIQADVRNPLLIELLRDEQVHTVCHLVFHQTTRPSEQSFETNVIGTMKLLGASAEAGVRKVVLKSSTAVYGALSTNPSFLVEEHPLQGSRAYGYTRDMVEIEAFCNGFRRQVPEMIQTILRFPSIVGPDADTPMTRFLREPLAPVLLGFDPMMQVIHEKDVVDALVHAILNDLPGAYNVAAEGVMPLSKLTALAGKIAIPWVHPFAYWGAALMGGSRGNANRYAPLEFDYLRYSWVADLDKMRQDFGFMPRYTAEEALREFAGQQRLRSYLPEAAALAYDEERLHDTIERRRRARTASGAQSVEAGTEEGE